jgi:hypothetical protein
MHNSKGEVKTLATTTLHCIFQRSNIALSLEWSHQDVYLLETIWSSCTWQQQQWGFCQDQLAEPQWCW